MSEFEVNYDIDYKKSDGTWINSSGAIVVSSSNEDEAFEKAKKLVEGNLRELGATLGRFGKSEKGIIKK